MSMSTLTCPLDKLHDYVLLDVCDKLSPRQLVKLAQTCWDLQSFVFYHYLMTTRGLNKLLPPASIQIPPHYDHQRRIMFAETSLQRLRKLILTLRPALTLIPYRDQRIFLLKLVRQVGGFTGKDMMDATQFDGACLFWGLAGETIRISLIGWPMKECTRFFRSLIDATELDNDIQRFLTTLSWYVNNGQKDQNTKKLQLYLRTRIRLMFLNVWTQPPNRFFFLTQLLQPYTVSEAARLFYLVLGPMLERKGRKRQSEVGWRLGHDTTLTENQLGTLGSGFAILCRGVRANINQYVLRRLVKERPLVWNREKIEELFKELTVGMCSWRGENRGQLLAVAGPVSAEIVLNERLQNYHSKVNSVALDLFHFAVISHVNTDSPLQAYALFRYIAKEDNQRALKNMVMRAVTLKFQKHILWEAEAMNDQFPDADRFKEFSKVVKSFSDLSFYFMQSNQTPE